jgi:hydrogenase expression/formation protein HypC
VLVFMDSARERISPERAEEVNATLDLVEAAMDGAHADLLDAELGFVLPSSMTPQQLAALSGTAQPSPQETP